MWYMSTLIALFVCIGCAAAPATRHNITTTWSTSTEFDKLWANTIQMFGSLDIPIQVLEKDSGIIISDWAMLHENDGLNIDCGTPSFGISSYEKQTKITVMIRDIESDRRQVTVKGLYRQRRYQLTTLYSGRTFYATCFSNGALEKNLKKHIFGLTTTQ